MKRLVVVFVILMAALSVTTVHAATRMPSSQCWQDSCDKADLVTCTNTHVNGSADVIDGYGHKQGTLYLESSGASGGGCMANYAAFVQLAGESLNGIVNLSIHRYYDSDSDTNAAFAPLIGPVSGPASYESPLLGFEGHGEDCFYAFIRIQSNDNSIQDAQTQGYCPQ